MKPYIRLVLLILLVTYLAGCTSYHSQGVYDAQGVSPFLQKTIKGKYEQIFHAAQLSLAGYPIAISDMEAGVLKTGIIRNEQMWLPPFLK